MLVYLAAPLFCQAERVFNLQLCGILEEQGFDVFLPQRDGVERSRPPYDALTADERARATFTIDRDKVLEADILLVVLDGRVPDEGACVELGLAYAQKHLLHCQKLLVGLQTDERAAHLDAKLNAMIVGALDHVVQDENELSTLLERWSSRTESTAT